MNNDPMLTVISVTALENYRLKVTFSDGITKVCDFKDLLHYPAFVPLNDLKVFNNVSVEYGCPVWNNCEIDISPEYLYRIGTNSN